MQLDAEWIRWLLAGIGFIVWAIISYLLKRDISRTDEAAKGLKAMIDKTDASLTAFKDGHDRDMSAAAEILNDLKLDLAEKYVSKIDLEKQLDTHLSPIRDDMRDIKGDIKALLQRP